MNLSLSVTSLDYSRIADRAEVWLSSVTNMTLTNWRDSTFRTLTFVTPSSVRPSTPMYGLAFEDRSYHTLVVPSKNSKVQLMRNIGRVVAVLTTYPDIIATGLSNTCLTNVNQRLT